GAPRRARAAHSDHDGTGVRRSGAGDVGTHRRRGGRDRRRAPARGRPAGAPRGPCLIRAPAAHERPSPATAARTAAASAGGRRLRTATRKQQATSGPWSGPFRAPGPRRSADAQLRLLLDDDDLLPVHLDGAPVGRRLALRLGGAILTPLSQLLF